MTVFIRSAAFVAAVFVIVYGLLITTSQASTLWLGVLGVAAILLTIAFWPRLPRSIGQTERGIIRCTVLFAIGFMLVSVQLVRVQVVDSREIAGRTLEASGDQVVQDPRRRLAASEIVRGSLLTRDGEVIAASSEQPDGRVTRSYPDPSTAYIAGYFSPLLYGSSNLERVYDHYLMGESGGNPVTEWLDGILHRTRNGYDLTLTLDSTVQRQANELLGDRRGAAIVMDAKTGAVVAMASKPNYEPGKLYVDSSSDEQQIEAAKAYWGQLNASAEGESPLVLRPTQGLYVPGSVFKTVTAAAILDTDLAEPDTAFRDEGALTVGSRVINEENRPDPNRVVYSLSEAYGYSLNVVFAQIGLQLGPDRLADYANRFGFGDTIPFDVPVATSRVATEPGFLDDPAGLAVTGFGQGQLQVTPLQMAMVAAAVANGGEMMAPYLLENVTSAEGKVLSTRSPDVWRRAISAETAEEMRQIMVQSVESGYASGAAIPGYQVGGKTGTAEVGDQTPHSWFIGFAGQDDPEYVVAVIVENGGSGSEVALPIGRQLLETALHRAAS